MADSNYDLTVDVRHLQMTYGPREVLKDVNLKVGRGEVLALLGPNGAGKTTTLEILEGFRRPSCGEVTVLGADPVGADEQWRARLGVVLQSWRDHGRWTVRSLLKHMGSYYKPYSTPSWKRPHDVDELLERVGLSEHGDQIVKRLSGGQRRRLDVAIGLVGNPELLFLDEPTVGFDPEARNEFHKIIRQIAEVEGTSVILTTHDLHEAEALADNIAILMDGRIAASGTSEQLSSEYNGRVTISYVSERRFTNVEVREDEVNSFLVNLLSGESPVTNLEVSKSSLEDTYLNMVGANGTPAPLTSGV